MPYQFENRYTLTDEMVLEYVSQVCCKNLLWGCFLIFSLGAGLCLLLFRFHQHIPAAIAGFLQLPVWYPVFPFQFSSCATPRHLYRVVPDRKPWCALANRFS